MIFALFILLPAGLAPGFAGFVPVFLAAVVFGVLSHAPGGLGVFEAAVIATVAAPDKAAVLAALLLYRVLYNILPFGVVLAAIALCKLRRGTGTASVRARV